MMYASWLDIAVSTYFTGLVISLVHSIKKYRGIRKIKTCFDYNLLATKPHMQSYLIMQPLLWPYYFCIEKSPLARFSELFFKHYGDAGHTYYGTQGIKNFLNDLVKGKNRYEVCNPKILYWPVDNTGQAYSDYARLFPKSEKLVTHTKIIYAKFEDKYLLDVHWQRDIKNNNQPISRFQLDECEHLSESELKDRLYQISPVKAQELLSRLNLI